MKEVDPGHVYELDNLDDPDHEVPKVLLYFVKREGEKYPGNVGHHAGTTVQEVCRALIARLQYVNDQESCEADRVAIQSLRDTIYRLEERAASRASDPYRLYRVKLEEIETYPTCPTCGHIFCRSHPQ